MPGGAVVTSPDAAVAALARCSARSSAPRPGGRSGRCRGPPRWAPRRGAAARTARFPGVRLDARARRRHRPGAGRRASWTGPTPRSRPACRCRCSPAATSAGVRPPPCRGTSCCSSRPAHGGARVPAARAPARATTRVPAGRLRGLRARRRRVHRRHPRRARPPGGPHAALGGWSHVCWALLPRTPSRRAASAPPDGRARAAPPARPPTPATRVAGAWHDDGGQRHRARPASTQEER